MGTRTEPDPPRMSHSSGTSSSRGLAFQRTDPEEMAIFFDRSASTRITVAFPADEVRTRTSYSGS